MTFQTLIVILLVSACSAYAAWQLMPQAARRGLAKALQRAPWPPLFSAWLQKTALADAGCGCSGCDQVPQKAGASAAHVLVFHPPKRR